MIRPWCTLLIVVMTVVLAPMLWAETFVTLSPPKEVGTPTCLATSGTTVFVGTTSGVAALDTKTQEWKIGKKPINTLHVVAIAASATECMAVTSDGALMFSFDLGVNWYQVQGMEHFSVATTVVYGKGQFMVGAANGLFSVNATQQLIVKLCPQLIQGRVLNIATSNDRYLVLHDGQSGASAVLFDGKSCAELSLKDMPNIAPVQSGFFGDTPLLLDEQRLLEWDETLSSWRVMLNLGLQQPATFLNINESDQVGVIGSPESLLLVNLNDRTSVNQTILPDLAMGGRNVGSGVFIGGRWTGISASGIILSERIIRDLIEEYQARSREFFIELADDVPTLLANVPYRMYSVECNNRTLIHSGVAGPDGRIRVSLAELGVDSTTAVEFEVTVKTETTDKVDRPAGFDTLYVQTIRNRRVLPDGTFQLPAIREIRDQRVVLGHTMIGFRLVAAVEWDADAEYIDTLRQWLSRSNDLLLDITNGQAFFERIYIADSKQTWGAKDIAFEASNRVWPHVNQLGGLYYGRPTQWIGYAAYMPRAHYGNEADNRNRSSSLNWLDLVGNATVTTLIHELGHHIFGWVDEYCSWLAWNNGPLDEGPDVGRCFGLMHYNYFFNVPDESIRMASELSSDLTVWTTGGGDLYSATFQFTTHRRPCWEHYRDSYTRTETIGGTRVRSRILRPADLTRAAGDSIILGPRDIVTNQANCLFQPPVEFIDRTVMSNATVGVVRVDNGGVGVPRIDVDVLENTTTRRKLHYQGQTSDGGVMRVLGIRPGNVVKVFGRNGFDRVTSSIATVNNGEVVVPVSGSEKGADRTQGEIELTISTEKSDVTSRRLFFATEAAQQSTSIEISDGSTLVDKRSLQFESGVTELSVPVQTSNGEKPLPISVTVINASTAENIYSHDGSAQFFKAPDSKLGGSVLIVGSGFLPPPFTGIGDNEEMLSELVSVASDGSIDALRSMQIRTWHAPAKGKYAVAHRWDRAAAEWKALPSFESDDASVVASVFDGPGTYAVFTRSEAVSSVHNSNDQSIHVAPNPANVSVTITTKDGATSVQVLDLAGSVLLTEDAVGSSVLTLDVSRLVQGLYFVRVVESKGASVLPLIIRR